MFTTEDGGENWTRQRTVPALAKEGAFAASNSCLTIRQPADAWIGTGGPTAARVLHSSDGGKTWTAASNEIPCFRLLISFLPSSHSNLTI